MNGRHNTRVTKIVNGSCHLKGHAIEYLPSWSKKSLINHIVFRPLEKRPGIYAPHRISADCCKQSASCLVLSSTGGQTQEEKDEEFIIKDTPEISHFSS